MASKNAVPVASTSSANRYGNPSATLGPSPASASSSSSTAGTNSRPTAGLNQVRSTSTSSASSSTAMNTPGLSSVAQGKRPVTGPTTGNSTSSSTAHRAIPGTANRPNSTTTSTTGTAATNSAAAHVRRGALNAVLVHTCQVNRSSVSTVNRTAATSSHTRASLDHTERKSRDRSYQERAVGIRRHQMRLPSGLDEWNLVLVVSRESDCSLCQTID